MNFKTDPFHFCDMPTHIRNKGDVNIRKGSGDGGAKDVFGEIVDNVRRILYGAFMAVFKTRCSIRFFEIQQLGLIGGKGDSTGGLAGAAFCPQKTCGFAATGITTARCFWGRTMTDQWIIAATWSLCFLYFRPGMIALTGILQTGTAIAQIAELSAGRNPNDDGIQRHTDG
jgi:hypothetical protein